MMKLDIRLLGPPSVERDGVPVEVDTRKAIALLARLVVDPGSHARDVLAAWLWPEADQQHARAALRRTLSTLIAAIGDAWIAVSRDTLSLHAADELHSDHTEFLALLHIAREPSISDERAITVLERIGSLYRDDFMAGFSLRDSPDFDDWQAYHAESLRRDISWALERTVAIRFAHGAFSRAVDPARRWLALDPLHEPAHRWLMQCYLGAGEHAAALAQYRECVRLLETELGVAPLADTTELYEAIRDRRVLAPVIASLAPVALAERGAVVPPTHARDLPLVGRDRECRRLQELHAAVTRDGCVVVIEGEAGVGKTRLADELVDHVRRLGGSVLLARCYEGETDLAYGVLIDMLRAGIAAHGTDAWRMDAAPGAIDEVARLIPELDPYARRASVVPADGPGDRSRFYAACTELLQSLLADGAAPGVAVFDDLHWSDDATLELLSWLTHRLDSRPFMLLATWRTEEVSPDHPLRRMLSTAERAGRAQRIVLERLSRDDVARLVETATGESRLANRLYEETEGLPFFVVEYLAEVADRSETGAAGLDMPRGVREILRSRVARAGEVERQLLSTGAAIGRSFDFDTLRVASGRGEDEVVGGIEHLLAAGLLTETAGPESSALYDFSHERLRAFVYAETSLARRRLLHRRIAEALAARGQGGSLVLPAQVANHFRLAGLDARAAEQFQIAGLHARTVYAHHDAIAHFQAALALGYPDPVELHQAIGDLRALLGEYSAAQASYEAALSRSAGAPDDAIALLEHRLGVLCQRRGDWARSESHFRAAEAGSRQSGPERMARLLADWSLSAHNLGDDTRAEALAERAITLAQAAADDRALAQTWNILGVLARSRGDNQDALRCLDESRAIAERLGDLGARAAALNNMALVQASLGKHAAAIELALAALADCIAAGDRHREAAILNNLADLYHARGQEDEAMAQLTRSAAIYAEIGTIDGEPQPEIWKLVEW